MSQGKRLRGWLLAACVEDLMDFAAMYEAFAAGWEDFWGRRGAEPAYGAEWAVFGQQVRLRSNDGGLVAAAEAAQTLYSTAPPTGDAPWEITWVVQPLRTPAGAAPDDLMQRITYTGWGDWLMMHLADWGQVFVDLGQKRAVAVLDPALAARPGLAVQCVLHTILLNLVIASGWGMLHASCLVQGERALLLLAPHGSGKSTTALRLALAGLRLMTDSMVFVRLIEGRPWLLGYPVGRVKLRADVAATLPQLAPWLEPEVVRAETKYRLDLRQVGAGHVVAEATCPAGIDLCLLARHEAEETVVVPAGAEEIWPALLRNSLYFDHPAGWRRNVDHLAAVVAQVRAFHLTVGRDPAGVVAAVRQIL